ncbi:MAG: ABC transporter permease [Vicinamibacterales bacterium]|jgi:predicted permease
MWTLWQDLRYSVRLLAKHPGFTLTAIGVLTLGIGVNAGIFGIINGLLLRPLAGAGAPGEVVGLFSHERGTTRGYRAFSYPGFDDVREAGGPFAHLAAHNVAMAGITEGGATRQSFVDIISAGYFDALGVKPTYGRDFTRDEERPGTPARSVIVSYLHWQRTGFDRDILKRTVRINGDDYGVVGVAPERFGGTTALIATEFWLPLGVHDAIESDFDSRDKFPLADRRNHSLIVLGRLKPAVTRAQADEQLKVIAAAHEQAFPDDNKNRDLIVRPLSRLSISTSPQDDTELWAPVALLQGLAAAVLLISCLNLANMMLAFGSTRQKEIAIRLAVGGSRARIVRQLLVQGLLLSLTGGALGLLVASWAAQLLVSSLSTVLPIAIALDVTPDLRVVMATFVFCTLATMGFGLWPALRLSRPDLLSSLKDQAGEISGRLAGRITVRGALVTTQLALSLALLVLSGLFVRGATAGASADPGFALEPLVVSQVDPRLGGYDEVKSKEVRRAVLERLRGTPWVDSAAVATVLPFGDYTMGAVVQREGRRLKNEDPDAKGKIVQVIEYVVGADYFRTLGLPMLRGREFNAAEEIGAGGTPSVIIDVALAERLFANEDPVGQLLQFGADSGNTDSRPMLIVGVAPGVKHDLFAARPEPHIYLPTGNSGSTRMFVYTRAAAPQNAEALIGSVREELRAVDADMPVMFVTSFRTQHERSAQVWALRAAARLFLTLGLAAAFVAVVGLYGVRSYLVSRRTREFGVRMAIGASPMDVMRLVIRETAWTTAAGVAIGLLLGILLGWGMSAVIYRVSPLDPVTLGGAAGLLAVASIIASVIPARRAAHVLPMTALRND